MDDQTWTVTVEDAQVLTDARLAERTFRVVWSTLRTWADVKVYEVTGRTAGGAPTFNRADARSLPDPVEDVSYAEVYLSGYIKSDGCMELGQEVTPHWCGMAQLEKHCALLHWLYERAMQLMGCDEADDLPWQGPTLRDLAHVRRVLGATCERGAGPEADGVGTYARWEWSPSEFKYDGKDLYARAGGEWIVVETPQSPESSQLS